MTISHKKQKAKLNLLLMSFLSGILYAYVYTAYIESIIRWG